jgi:predicted dienelactone hydrolase
MPRALAALLVIALGAVAAAAPDPAKAGRFAVGMVTVDAVDASRGRTLPTEIWYPARSAARDATPLARAYPLVLVAHGHCGSRTNYEYLTAQLASHGFVVAAPDFPTACVSNGGIDVDANALDLSFVCRELHDPNGPLGPWARHVRGVPTGLVGHSLGGLAAIEATKIDRAFTAVVPLAPLASAETAPPLADLPQHPAWMVMGGTADALIGFAALTEPFFAGLEAPAFLVRITGGTHSGFTDQDASLTPEALAAQQTIIKRYATAFFVKYLGRKARFGRRLRSFDDGTVMLVAHPR